MSSIRFAPFTRMMSLRALAGIPLFFAIACGDAATGIPAETRDPNTVLRAE